MRRSKTEIYLHYVWATYHRMPLITPALEADLYCALTEQAHRLGCRVMALGGLEDHVHMVVCAPAKHAPSEIAKQLKGASTAWVRRAVRPEQPLSAEPFGWQDNTDVLVSVVLIYRRQLPTSKIRNAAMRPRNCGPNGKKLTARLNAGFVKNPGRETSFGRR